ncbi:MAG: FHA domain-containing protein [Actinobacteria bacterium]|nr:FHA domain-containing protein [Actinomycetota bacterium]
MTLEPVLLGFKVLFLLLLYLFIFRVVRGVARDLKGGGEPAVMPAPASVRAAPVAAAAIPPKPAPMVRGERRPERTGESEDEVGNTSEFDYLTAKIKPRLIVQHSKVVDGGKAYRLKGGATIGRSPRSDIVLDDSYVSSTHARIFSRRQFLYLEDLGSTNGTYVDGRRVSGDVQIKPGQEIVIGDTIFRYEE